MPSLLLRNAPDISLDATQTAVIHKFVKVSPEESRCIAFHKVGTGKTRLAYGWLLYLRDLHRAKRCLVIIRPKALYDWKLEAYTIGLDLNQVTFVSFANLKTVNLKTDFDTVIIDELFLFGNPRCYRSRRLGYICTKADNVLGLSGTVLPKKDNTPIWGYCVAVGIASCIARGITDFRSRYQTGFSPKFNPQLRLFTPRPGWDTEVFSRLANHVSFYFPRDYVRSIDKEISVTLSPEQRNLINKLVKLYVLDTNEGEVFLTRAADVYHKVRNILNGWIVTPSGKLQLVDSEKRAALLHKVTELHESGERCIVWCAYRNDVVVIRRMLPMQSVALVGGSKFDIPAWTGGAVRIVVATMGSGQSVNYLNSIKWGLFFSLSTKRLDWQQSRGRMGRRGSDEFSTNQFIRYSVANSLDGKIYDRIQTTDNAEEALIKEFQRDYNIRLPY